MYGLSLLTSSESVKQPPAAPSRRTRRRSKPLRIRVLALRAGGRGRVDLAASRAETLVSEA